MPGTSGNPAGRPVGRGSITTELRRLLVETDADGVPLHERIARRLLALAEGGDLRAIREVLDRVDGLASRVEPEPDDRRIELLPITFERRD
jgi:hypothetical protein